MAKPSRTRIDRRRFLEGAAAGAAVLATKPAAAATEAVRRRGVAVPNAAQLAAEARAVAPPVSPRIVERPGSDFMLDVLKTFGFEYCTMNPGSSFEGLHESIRGPVEARSSSCSAIVNHGSNVRPELLTCCHEESAVAMAHGFAKIEGKPLLVLLHGNVGLQHASMAVYNAYADRVPVYLVVGNHMDTAGRRGGVPWYHSAQDMASMVRDYVKWDDEPASLSHFAESAVRAYRIAMTPPMAPVALVVDSDMQEHAMPAARPRIPRLTTVSTAVGDAAVVKEAARLLVAAETPLIVAQRCARTPAGIRLLVELAEALHAPVTGIQATGATVSDRMNFPSRHPLCGNGWPGYAPDVTLGLEVQDMSAAAQAAAARNATTISISAEELVLKSNYQDMQRLADVDIAIAADAEATLPSLVEEVRRQLTADRRRALQERGTRLAEAHHKLRLADLEMAASGWDASPISVARLCAEVWDQIRNDDWSLVSWQGFLSKWPYRLWSFEKQHHYIGGQGAGGMGYGSGAAVGAALANKKHGRLSVNIEGDGDLNYAPGVLWTAAHHKIPLLTLVHNNRGYHQEVMFVQQMASERNRGADRAHIGTVLTEPNIDYAKMAESYGMLGIGPIAEPRQLAPALKRALEHVRRGEPALVDVVSQPR